MALATLPTPDWMGGRRLPQWNVLWQYIRNSMTFWAIRVSTSVVGLKLTG